MWRCGGEARDEVDGVIDREGINTLGMRSIDIHYNQCPLVKMMTSYVFLFMTELVDFSDMYIRKNSIHLLGIDVHY